MFDVPNELGALIPTEPTENNLDPVQAADELNYTSPATSPLLEKEGNTTNPLEQLRPFPKAGPRKMSNRVGRKRTTAILTDTPVKGRLEAEKLATLSKKNDKAKRKLLLEEKRKNTKSQTRPKTSNKKSKTNKKQTPKEGAAEEEAYCLVCQGPWSGSKPGETWLQCRECKQWSHSDCTDDPQTYTHCHDCV